MSQKVHYSLIVGSMSTRFTTSSDYPPRSPASSARTATLGAHMFLISQSTILRSSKQTFQNNPDTRRSKVLSTSWSGDRPQETQHDNTQGEQHPFEQSDWLGLQRSKGFQRNMAPHGVAGTDFQERRLGYLAHAGDGTRAARMENATRWRIGR
jgi:hypothetical protein